MTNEKLLHERIEKSGLKLKVIIAKCGLSYQGFYNKAHNRNSFTATEIQSLCEVLGITSLRDKESIFFAGDVD